MGRAENPSRREGLSLVRSKLLGGGRGDGGLRIEREVAEVAGGSILPWKEMDDRI